MKNTIKIIVLGVIGFGLLVYLTAPEKPKKIEYSIKNEKITLDSFPRFFNVVSKGEYTKYKDVFNKQTRYLVVLNHDCLPIFKDLYKYTKQNIVLVANISNTPWLIKKLAVDGELENMYKDSTIPLINDSDGILTKILNISNAKQNSYFVFKIDENKKIIKLFSDEVKLNALEKGVSKEEIETQIKGFLKKIEKKTKE